jgi:hypothetical protein
MPKLPGVRAGAAAAVPELTGSVNGLEFVWMGSRMVHDEGEGAAPGTYQQITGPITAEMRGRAEADTTPQYSYFRA